MVPCDSQQSAGASLQPIIIDFGSASKQKASGLNIDALQKKDAKKFMSEPHQLQCKNEEWRSDEEISAFAIMMTMPTILPPCSAESMGSAMQRDAFALGLVIASLVRQKITQTKDVFDDAGLVSEWWHPLRPVTPCLAALIEGLLCLDPKQRMAVGVAIQVLPLPHMWYRKQEAGALVSL